MVVFRECKHIKNIFEDVYFTKNSFHITLNINNTISYNIIKRNKPVELVWCEVILDKRKRREKFFIKLNEPNYRMKQLLHRINYNKQLLEMHVSIKLKIKS